MSLWIHTDWREAVVQIHGLVKPEHVEEFRQRLLACVAQGYRRIVLHAEQTVSRECEKMLDEVDHQLIWLGGALIRTWEEPDFA
ncbi:MULTISPECIES: hypothetical protein [Sporomusaceae]|uniref:hypothetical protein n=1 Tax=Sporomusaceae TaxID=1843490 RepID=UPI00035E14E1|nr:MULTISPECIES: hypothetical protein [Sporomusaceae]